MTYRKTGQTGKELCRLWWTAQKDFQNCPSQPWFPHFIHLKVTPSNRENKMFSSSSFLPLPPVTPVQFYFSLFLISFLQIDERSPSNRNIYVSKPAYWNNQHLTQWLAIKLQLHAITSLLQYLIGMQWPTALCACTLTIIPITLCSVNKHFSHVICPHLIQ